MDNREQIERSPSSRVRVNGGKIKFLRESKGLTQLYVATALGITTDTVSRWENGKYPTVKWDNVERLAQALEVAADELLDRKENPPGASPSPREPVTGGPEKPGRIPKGYLPAISLLALALLLVGGLFIKNFSRAAPRITATRFLPRHLTPGQPFPVVVRVDSNNGQPFTFILEEQLPADFTAVKGLPEIASLDADSNAVKWIGNCRQPPLFLAYLVQTPPTLHPAGSITFHGRIKADQLPRSEQEVVGERALTISNYHWADTNSDGVIDDDEILTAFSSADLLGRLGLDLGTIKKIWSAGGYSWNREDNQYRITGQTREAR